MENEKVSALFAIVIRLSGSGLFAEYSESVPEEWFFAQFLSFVHTCEKHSRRTLGAWKQLSYNRLSSLLLGDYFLLFYKFRQQGLNDVPFLLPQGSLVSDFRMGVRESLDL